MHYSELAEKIKELEIRYNKQFSDIYEVLSAMQEDKKQLDDFANRERRIRLKVWGIQRRRPPKFPLHSRQRESGIDPVLCRYCY
jgi:hypothetical protein